VAPWYAVAWELNGGAWPGGVSPENQVETGGKITRPADPVKANYALAGWYKEAALTTLWDFDTDTVRTGITLHARWIPSYTVTFNVDGGTPAPAAQTVAEGGTVTAPAAPAKAGYAFGGWHKEAALTTLWDFDTDTVTADISLYAKWIPTYTVSFNANGGTPVPAVQTVAEGGKVTAPLTPAKAIHDFGGWYKEAALTTPWDFAADTVTADITLYARWTTSSFTTPAQYRTMVPLSGGTITGNSAYYYDSRYDNTKGVFIEGRTVILSPFSIAKYETTYELWYEVKQWAVGNGYTFGNADREGHDGTIGAAPTTAAKIEPVTWLTWRDAVVWCNAYSEMSGKEPVYYTDTSYTTILKNPTSTEVENAKMKPGANGYRLPTEAEWEYAARGGTPSLTGSFAYKWAGTNTESALGNYAWYYDNSGSATHTAGGKTANSVQLYDMSGNVWEWCWDWYGTIGTGTANDPTGPATGTARVMRGGTWKDDASSCAVALRTYNNPSYGFESHGFRVACTGWSMPGYTISGTISTNNPGGAASGASVQLQRDGGNVGNPVNTGTGGAYTIPNVLAGNVYTIKVSLNGYVPGTISSFNVTGNVTGKNLTLVKDRSGEKTTYTGSGISFKTAYVRGGLTFPTEDDDSETATVAAAYEIGETAVTYELWYTVRSWAGSKGYTFYNNPGREGSSASSQNTTPGANRQEPVTMVTWFDAVVWLNALTEWVNEKTGSSLTPVYYYNSAYTTVAKNSNPSSNFVKENSSYNYASAYAKPGTTGFRLPSENEWELAARWRGNDTTNVVNNATFNAAPWFTKGNSASGATASYTNTSATGAVAWYLDNASSKTHAVKGKAANGLGLYDMSGNVNEWCFDRYSSGGDHRMMRGEAFSSGNIHMQVGSSKIGGLPDYRYPDRGFRPARTAQ
jgi:uncharacterized repeat protein (TIGR02543 family)